MGWLRRLLNTVRPSRVQRDIERELAFHLAERSDQLRAEGASDADARRRARLQFGNPLVQAERVRDVDLTRWLDALLRALRYATRANMRTPGFSATVVVTLAVAIGANTAVFSVIDAVLLETLPVPDADRLVRVRQVRETETAIAPDRLDEWSRLSSSFDALSGYYTEDVSDTTGSLPEERPRRDGDDDGASRRLGRDVLRAEERVHYRARRRRRARPRGPPRERTDGPPRTRAVRAGAARWQPPARDDRERGGGPL